MKVLSSAPRDAPVRGWRTTNPHPPTTHSLALVFVAAAAYLAAHLPFLAPALEDIDSINFALGLRAFNPALHQPHPPGYPVYMALGHASLALVERLTSMTMDTAEAWSLAVWSAIGGAACIVAAWWFFMALADRPEAPDARFDTPGNTGPAGDNRQLAAESQTASIALWAALLLAASPLFWMTGLRPMSDMPGLALAIGAQALMLRGANSRRLVQGALLAGVATGIRVQTAALTVPLMGLILYERWAGRRTVDSSEGRQRPDRERAAPVVQPLLAFTAGCLVWGIPLIVASGGVKAYVAALQSQAGEDFAWVDMLWASPTPRHIAITLYQTLVLPWASIPLAAAVGIAAAVGALATLLREPHRFLVLAVAFVPYVVFHMLFQQTDTIRYALPVLPGIVWLAARGMALTGRLTAVVAVPFVVSSLIVAVPGGVAYGRDPHPAFRAIADAVQRARVEPPAAVFSHYGIRRSLQAADTGPLRVVEPPLRYEWLGLVDYWRAGGTAPVWFLADQRRTDLALIDPQSRHDVVRYRWSVEERPELGGTRPLGVDWYRFRVPGWFAGQGWSLTPEAGGITDTTSMGPDHRPIEAWVRRRPGPFHLVVGGRHLGTQGDGDAELQLAVDGRPVDRWRLAFKDLNFLRFIDLPDGIGGPGTFASLTIASRSLDTKRAAPVAIRQFDIQPEAQLIYGFGEGWHEDEFDVNAGLRWRWTSERSILRIQGPPQAVRITLRGESPVHYLDAPPTVKMTVGGATIAELRPVTDFEWSVVVPADALTRSGGAVAIETDRVYLPGPAEGTSDERHLGLRIFECRVESLFR